MSSARLGQQAGLGLLSAGATSRVRGLSQGLRKMCGIVCLRSRSTGRQYGRRWQRVSNLGIPPPLSGERASLSSQGKLPKDELGATVYQAIEAADAGNSPRAIGLLRLAVAAGREFGYT